MQRFTEWPVSTCVVVKTIESLLFFNHIIDIKCKGLRVTRVVSHMKSVSYIIIALGRESSIYNECEM